MGVRGSDWGAAAPPRRAPLASTSRIPSILLKRAPLSGLPGLIRLAETLSGPAHVMRRGNRKGRIMLLRIAGFRAGRGRAGAVHSLLGAAARTRMRLRGARS